MSTINSNNTTGINYTSDTTGTLQLQTLGSNAVSISTAQVVSIPTTTAATSTTTGALVVTGGIGTGGDIYATGNIYTNGQLVPSLASIIAWQLAL